MTTTIMEDNCSNCISSRVRRAEPFCTNKKSKHHLTVTSLHHKCIDHGRGTQVEIFGASGKKIFP